MAEKKPKRSTLGNRMNDCYFIVEDASGKPKGVMDGTKAARPQTDPEKKG